jgi:hypothetical protein
MIACYGDAMPTHRGHHYDTRPRRPGWTWSAYDRDRITPIARGEEDTKGAAESAAMSAIESHLERQDDDDPAP